MSKPKPLTAPMVRAMFQAIDTARAMEKAMGPDYSREGLFVYHNCAYCDDGKKPCRQGNSSRCDNPRARND